MRVVLDTNILISACWKPGGNEAAVVALMEEGVLAPCVSEAIVTEYREVAARPKFAAQRECLESAIAAVLARAVGVAPEARCAACTDADDNRLLGCAVAAGARYVVTGNLRHFPAEWDGVAVINARTLLDRLGR